MVVKPNIGGSGAGIIRFDRPEQLKSAVEENQLYFGIDQVALVQECFQARDSVITRVEVLGGKFLYGIQIHTTGDTFNLCPGDICHSTKGEELARTICPVDAPNNGMKVEGYAPQLQVIQNVVRIMQVSGIQHGVLLYFIDHLRDLLIYSDANQTSTL